MVNYAKVYGDLKNGATASTVANEYGIHKRTVWKIAKKHALRNDLEWPINRNSTRELDEYQKSDYPEFKETINRLRKSRQTVRMLVINDCHIPNHDVKAINVMLKVGEDLGIDLINDLSDVFEFETYGKWDALPETEVNDQLKRYLKSYASHRDLINDALKNPISIGIMGNHDRRLYDFLARKSPQVKSIVLDSFVEKIRSTGTLFFGEQTQTVEIGELLWSHGKYTGDNAAKTQYMKAGVAHKYSITGHLHRLLYYYQTVKKNEKPYIVHSYVTGCLCNFSPCYSPSNDMENWQHGFAIIQWDTATGHMYFQNVLIDENYQVTLGNKTYKADT